MERRRQARGAVAVLVALATALVLVPLQVGAGAAAPTCATPWGSLPKTGEPYNTLGSITNLRSGRHDCYDRLVIDMAGKGPSSYDVRYVDEVSAPGSGAAIPLRGGADIRILLQSPAYDIDTGQATYNPANDNEAVNVGGYSTFRQVAFAGSFEAQTVIGLGVRARLPMRVFSADGPGSGSRLVIDVAHRWPAEASGPALPGEPATAPFELGTRLAVAGVAADDVLNVRELPGASQPIVTRLDPLETNVFFAGQARKIGSSVWYQIDVGNYSGWVNSRYVTIQGGTFDVTSQVVAALGGYPTGGSVEEIGDQVVATQTGDSDPPPTVVVSAGPSEGDLHEITYDLTGYHDDSVFGGRVHVFAAPADDGSGQLGLKSVEVTHFCLRAFGATGSSGLCV